MNSCIFCKIIVNKLAREDIIYEDERVLVMLDIDRAVKGHTLVVWKEHHDNISDLVQEELEYFSRIVH